VFELNSMREIKGVRKTNGVFEASDLVQYCTSTNEVVSVTIIGLAYRPFIRDVK
jgi:hypothetical protein